MDTIKFLAIIFLLLPTVGFAQTHKAAVLRDKQVKNVHYHASMDLTRDPSSYSVNGEVWFDVKKQAATLGLPIFLDLENAKVSKIEINGKVFSGTQISSVYDGQEIHLNLSTLKPSNNHVKVAFTHPYVNLTPETAGAMGFLKFIDPADGRTYLYTNLQPDGARQILPCFDQPSIKGTFALDVVAPQEWQLVANTLESTVTPFSKNKKAWHFPATLRAPTYVFHLSAGPWASWSYPTKVDGIPLRLFARQSIAPRVDAKQWLEQFAGGLHYINGLLGMPYPFGKLDQVIQPLFRGTMENLGAIGVTEVLVYGLHPEPSEMAQRGVMLFHEITHMWFGNLISAKWWSDFSMIEGFCETFNLMAVKNILKYPQVDVLRNNYYLIALATDLSAGAYPITQDVPTSKDFDNFLTSFLLRKSAAALWNFQSAVGDDTFIALVRAYVRKYAFKNVGVHEFYDLAQNILHRNFEPWRKYWYETTNVNHFRIHPECQTPSCSKYVLPKSESAKYGAVDLTKEEQSFVIKFLPQFSNPVDRTVLWGALWLSVEENTLSPQKFLDVVYENLPLETQPELIHRIIWMTNHAQLKSILTGVIQLLPVSEQSNAKDIIKVQLEERIRDNKNPAEVRRVLQTDIKTFN